MSAGAPLPTFEVHEVCKRFGDVIVLNHVSLTFGEGRHALLGPNGSGKTTLLRVLAGRTSADSGEARCLGTTLKAQKTASRPAIRYLTQHFSLYLELTARENLEFTASMYGVSHREQAVEVALYEFDLLGVQAQRAQVLSGGVRQRLMLAAALLGEPQILLMDEPTAALDSSARHVFWQQLNRRRTSATTVILTTHLDADVALCDTATYLRAGRVVSSMTVAA